MRRIKSLKIGQGCKSSVGLEIQKQARSDKDELEKISNSVGTDKIYTENLPSSAETAKNNKI